MILKIHVTKKDIAIGRRCMSNECPVAFAMIRAIDQAGERCVSVYAGPFSLQYTIAGLPGYWCATTQPEASHFMTKFDECKPASPFAFEVDFQYREGTIRS